jgi:hypothetical protein
MSLTPELRARFFPVRETCFEAAIKIKPCSDAYGAAQRVLDLMEAEELGKSREFDEQSFQDDLNTILLASGVTDNDLAETLRKCGQLVISMGNNKNSSE